MNARKRAKAKRGMKNKMLKCPLCKRQTERGETTGQFLTMVYQNPENKSEGKRIFKSKKVCMDCNGECLLK